MGNHCRTPSRGILVYVLERPWLLCGGRAVGGRSEAGRLVSERDLSTFTCPEGQEAYAIPGSGILAATSEDGKGRWGRHPRCCKMFWQREWWAEVAFGARQTS